MADAEMTQAGDATANNSDSNIQADVAAALGLGGSAPSESKEDASDKAASDSLHRSKKTMAIRPYLDSTVVPVLLAALSHLVKERPDTDEVEYLAHYMLRNNPNKSI